jgi:hypothetical protein
MPPRQKYKRNPGLPGAEPTVEHAKKKKKEKIRWPVGIEILKSIKRKGIQSRQE